MTGMRNSEFVPARTIDEAAVRIRALTGLAPEPTRGEKRSLMALRDVLGLDVEVTATNASLGESIAGELGVAWRPSDYVERTHLTLDGVNALLEGATAAFRAGTLVRHAITSSPGLTGPEWADFRPAVTKIEAVTRISALTGSGPEDLGPGSKERKRVLINLATKLLPTLDQSGLSKTQLAAAIADGLGVEWSDDYASTGETIRLSGLNVLLAAAERFVGEPRGYTLSGPDEGNALVAALYDKLPDPRKRGPWDGKEMVTWLKTSGSRQQNQTEWPGFYFEFKGREILNAAFSPLPDPPQQRFGNTEFDYALGHVWDLKAHTAGQYPNEPETGGEVILNDADAFKACVRSGGLGFLVLNGIAHMDDDGEFKRWHDEFKGKPARPGNSTRSRARKAQFEPTMIEAFWIDGPDAFEEALRTGALEQRPQGRQPDGSRRADKIHMRLAAARDLLRIAHKSW